MSNRDERDEMVVLLHAGKSYVRCDYHSMVYQQSPSGDSGHISGVFINGVYAKSYPRAPGDENFIEIPGTVEVAEKRHFPEKVVLHYEANPEFSGLKTPISVDEYKAIAEDRRKILYHSVWREETQAPTPIKLKILDADAAPRSFPAGVRVTVPDYLRLVKSLWHTLPCVLLPEALYARLSTAVREEARGRAHFSVTDYESAKSVRVSARVDVKGFPGTMSFELFHYAVEGNYGATRFPTIQGQSLDDLEAQIAKWIEALIKKMRDVHTPQECPCCGQMAPAGMLLVQPSPWRAR